MKLTDAQRRYWRLNLLLTAPFSQYFIQQFDGTGFIVDLQISPGQIEFGANAAISIHIHTLLTG